MSFFYIKLIFSRMNLDIKNRVIRLKIIILFIDNSKIGAGIPGHQCSKL